jgi:hypothetical protein
VSPFVQCWGRAVEPVVPPTRPALADRLVADPLFVIGVLLLAVLGLFGSISWSALESGDVGGAVPTFGG